MIGLIVSAAFHFEFILATDSIDGRGLSNKIRHQYQPKEE